MNMLYNFWQNSTFISGSPMKHLLLLNFARHKEHFEKWNTRLRGCKQQVLYKFQTIFEVIGAKFNYHRLHVLTVCLHTNHPNLLQTPQDIVDCLLRLHSSKLLLSMFLDTIHVISQLFASSTTWFVIPFKDNYDNISGMLKLKFLDSLSGACSYCC